MLKMLEGEYGIIPGRAILPMLDNNIKCGNSLISGDTLELKEYFGDDWYKVNSFNWEKEFRKIMVEEGGFDAVIGNPPYIRIQTMKEWAPREVELYKKYYTAASKGNYDIYVVFVERGLNLLNKGGRLGFILPHKFFNSQYGQPLRTFLAKGHHLAEVVHFGDKQIFAGATNYTCLLFLDKAGNKKCHFIKVDDLTAWRSTGEASERIISSARITPAEWNFAAGKGAPLFEKLSKMSVRLGDIGDIFVGLQTSADDVFIMDLIEETPRTLRLKSKALDIEWTFEKGLLFPLVSGTDVNRYSDLPERQYILFPYKVDGKSVELIDFDVISKTYPKTAAYLLKNKERLEGRERGKFKGHDWYQFGRSQNIGIQEQIKLCVPRLVTNLYAAYDVEGNHFLDNVDVGGITLKSAYEEQGLVYLLGLLNSRLLRWYFPFVSAPFRGGWMSANRQFLAQLPIRSIDLGDPKEKKFHDDLVELVNVMLDLTKKVQTAKGSEKEQIQRQVEKTDREIDEMVYNLYGITKVERKIIEGEPT
jgi:hypothetical protein